MVDSIFRSLSKLLHTQDNESSLALPCSRDVEADAYNSVFVTAFLRYIQTQKSLPMHKFPHMTSSNPSIGNYAYTLDEYSLEMKFDEDARTYTISSEPQYDKLKLQAEVENLNRTLFYDALQIPGAVIITPKNIVEAKTLPGILKRLAKAHKITFSFAPHKDGVAIDIPAFNAFSGKEKLPGLKKSKAI